VPLYLFCYQFSLWVLAQPGFADLRNIACARIIIFPTVGCAHNSARVVFLATGFQLLAGCILSASAYRFRNKFLQEGLMISITRAQSLPAKISGVNLLPLIPRMLPQHSLGLISIRSDTQKLTPLFIAIMSHRSSPRRRHHSLSIWYFTRLLGHQKFT